MKKFFLLMLFALPILNKPIEQKLTIDLAKRIVGHLSFHLLANIFHEIGHSCAGKILFNDTGTIHFFFNPFKNPYVQFKSQFPAGIKHAYVSAAGPLAGVLFSCFVLKANALTIQNSLIKDLASTEIIAQLWNFIPGTIFIKDLDSYIGNDGYQFLKNLGFNPPDLYWLVYF